MSTTTTFTMTPTGGDLELSSFVAPPPAASLSSKGSRRLGMHDDGITVATATPPPGKSGADVDIESQPPSPTRDSDIPPERAVTAHNTAMERNIWWKTAATFFSLWMAGFQDGSTGALIPYLKVRYNIGLAFVALVYISTFLGWFAAAMINVHLIARLGMGGVLFFGSILQLTQYALQCWQPPYPVFVIAFFIGGIGVAVQDAQTNTFNANLPRAHLFLGLGHGFYGVGALVSPLIAATIANLTPDFRYWYYFYFAAVGLAVVNMLFIAFTFREVIFPPLLRRLTGKPSAEVLERSDKKNSKEAHKDFKAIIKRKEVWILAAYFFAYVGAEVTAGGWVVEFMIEVRGGKPSQVGYIGSAFWGGLTLGRFVLAEPTNRWGEHRMVLIYTGLAIAVELVFWFVPNIVVGGVMIGLLGFLIGPFFPVGISLATKLIPRELHAGSIGFMTVLGSAGGAVFPFLTGAVASSKGVQVLQPILCALFVVQVLLWLSVPRVKQPVN